LHDSFGRKPDLARLCSPAIELAVPDSARPVRGARAEAREIVELRAIKARHPELAGAVDMQIELLDLQRRVHGRIPLPWFELTTEDFLRHQLEGRPIVRFEDIPLDLTDLRLMVRQTADILRRFGTLDEPDYARIQTLGRDMKLLEMAGDWYRHTERHTVAAAATGAIPAQPQERAQSDAGMLDQVLALAMRPFLMRCAEVIQRRSDLSIWTHGHCPLCGGEPELAAITPGAERHLICGRCQLRWNFESLTCPFCGNSDRSRITSFATPDGQYRVYACDACLRYLKAHDGRHATRPVMPVVDGVATLPLDAAAMQRGYSG
jgi:FdhE protein